MTHRRTVRFLGDPIGYVVDNYEAFDATTKGVHWIRAQMGRTDRTVLIDISKAYVMEDVELDDANL